MRQHTAQGFQITKELVKAFGDVVYDHNPLHFDEQYAATTRFKRPIAHGALLGGIVSGMLVQAYGEGTIYVGLSLSFIKPVYVDSHVRIALETLSRKETDKVTKVRITITNEATEIVISGFADIIPGAK